MFIFGYFLNVIERFIKLLAIENAFLVKMKFFSSETEIKLMDWQELPSSLTWKQFEPDDLLKIISEQLPK